MIRHDHGPLSISTRNDDDQITLVRMSFLIVQPAAGPREIKIGFPLKRQFAGQGLVLHLGGGDYLTVIFQQIIAQGFQIALMVREGMI